MSDRGNDANELFFAPGVEFDEPERRRQAAAALIYNTSEDLLVCLESRNVTKAELARRIDMNPSQLSRVLSGEQNMTLRTLSDICFALDIEPRFDGLVSEGHGAAESSADPIPIVPGCPSDGDAVRERVRPPVRGLRLVGNPIEVGPLHGDGGMPRAA